MPNDHRKPSIRVSRVGTKPKGSEMQRVSMETVIWSDLQGDLQQPDVGGERGCALSRTKVSADLFLGVPFNIASYALLTQMLAQQCGLKLGDLIWTGGDVHIYKNHIEQVETQLSREPRMLPVMYLKRRPASIFDYKYEDFELAGYDPHPTIKAPVAV